MDRVSNTVGSVRQTFRHSNIQNVRFLSKKDQVNNYVSFAFVTNPKFQRTFV